MVEVGVEASVGKKEACEVKADTDSICAVAGDGTFVEMVGFTKTGFPDFCVFWNGNRIARFLSFSGVGSGPTEVLSCLGGTTAPREVFELYPLSEIGPPVPSRELLTSTRGDGAVSFLGDLARGVPGCISTAEAKGASISLSCSRTEKNDAGETGRSVAGGSANVSSINDRLPCALSEYRRTDPSDAGESTSSCTTIGEEGMTDVLVGV